MNTNVGSVSPGRCSFFTEEMLGMEESNWCMIKKTNFKFASPCTIFFTNLVKLFAWVEGGASHHRSGTADKHVYKSMELRFKRCVITSFRNCL